MYKKEENNIKRSLYLNKILPFVDQNLIKVLVGQRRVGKSWLLFQVMDVILAKDQMANMIYINKELHEFDGIQDNKSLTAYILNRTREDLNNYVFIDEIQDILHFEKTLRSLQARGDHDIYITGSNAFLLSGELATYLSGRYIEFKIYGLTYSEFLNFRGADDAADVFLNYLRYGGLPYLIHLELKDDIVFDYLRNIYAAILFKDVVARHNIRNVSLLQNLVKFVADSVGSLLSAKSISDFLKAQKIAVTPNLIQDYLSHLEQAFFVFKVNRLDVRGKKIFETGQKFYLEDLGLRHSLLGYRPADIGKIIENSVYLHLLAAGYEVFVGKYLDKEIDFVCQRRDERIYVQVCYLLADQKTIDREFGNLQLIRDNYPKYVVTMDEQGVGNYEGIQQLSVREFLLKIIPPA